MKRKRAPRQIDVFATRSDELYLVETKWRKSKADIGDVDSLLSRLESTPSSVTGLLVSVSGFSTKAIERVQQRSNRPVVLLSGDELEHLLRYEQSLTTVLRQKFRQLTIHNEVMIGVDFRSQRSTSSQGSPTWEQSSRSFVLPDGVRKASIHCGGDFGEFVFVKELPDIDWVPGSGAGVAVDITVSVEDEAGLLRLTRGLTDLGWTTSDASWSIQQSTRNWHGVGLQSFAEQLVDWERRYAVIETHHTEEFCYFDRCDGGFYTLSGNVSAHESRHVRQARLSFQLTGIPLDTKPLRHLCEEFDSEQPVFFRPRASASVDVKHLSPADRVIIAPVMQIVDTDVLGDEEWVTGIVVRNPYFGNTKASAGFMPEMLLDSEYLICDLRSWHERKHRGLKYELWDIESAWTSDAQVVRVIADWVDDEPTTMLDLPFAQSRS